MSTGAKETIASIQARKAKGEKIPCLTAYDYPTAKLFDEAGVPLLLVGDSLGMVVLGYPDTVDVTMADIQHHLRAAARARPRALLGADLPAGAYAIPELALKNAQDLVKNGAEFVKAEGGQEIISSVQAITQSGIPFMGHLGMLPQHIREEGKYRIKGKVEDEKSKLIADAQSLEKAGAFAIVLELVTPPVAEEISRQLRIPTIGIGSGPNCDGQILVYPDLVGLFPWFTPRFVQPRLAAGSLMQDAVRQWMGEVAAHNH